MNNSLQSYLPKYMTRGSSWYSYSSRGVLRERKYVVFSMRMRALYTDQSTQHNMCRHPRLESRPTRKYVRKQRTPGLHTALDQRACVRGSIAGPLAQYHTSHTELTPSLTPHSEGAGLGIGMRLASRSSFDSAFDPSSLDAQDCGSFSARRALRRASCSRRPSPWQLSAPKLSLSLCCTSGHVQLLHSALNPWCHCPCHGHRRPTHRGEVEFKGHDGAEQDRAGGLCVEQASLCARVGSLY